VEANPALQSTEPESIPQKLDKGRVH